MDLISQAAIITLVSHLLFIAVAFFALQALNFESILKKNKVLQARLLYLLLAIALGYGVSAFFLSYLQASQNMPSF
ncbi:DUF1146 family protein [Brochothrix campestris]|uniref:DUF1146 domain-containing protein n=1 Tax=Brochothrix campestris FSL F6-1037 TaxID=1265861 RepID=W7CT09_9LIST|nr:DUF1146 family protein [Brochothrix campestris]EUJ40047.1 hypothetical protein BCAMP_06375 [Brochothrix campestris FSL F6-1037]